MKHINLDANASYGLLPEVVKELGEIPSSLLNPSSVHSFGQRARRVIEAAREELALLCGLTEHRVIFTSGATEANNLAVYLAASAAEKIRTGPSRFLASAVEHISLLEPLRRAVGAGLILIAPSRKYGLNVEELLNSCDENTRFVSIMLANNETGHIFPVPEIVCKIRARFPKILIHTDAVQALGRMPIDINELGVDLMSISGHKLGALTGIGALIIRKDLEPTAQIIGGPQEFGWRAGTENVLGISSLGIAARIARERLAENMRSMRIQRDCILELITAEVPDLELNAALSDILPNTLNIRIPGVHADDLVVGADLEGVCISSGAACASGKPQPSHVLLALGRSEEQARESIRISIRADLQKQELEQAVSVIIRCIKQIRLRPAA